MNRKNILQEIVAEKEREVALRKDRIPVRILESSALFGTPCRSFSKALNDPGKTGIIAEFKRRSPSLGWINREADIAGVTAGYTQLGASAVSVLTDEKFFGGSLTDLGKARNNDVPLLRKDFIIDEYQVLEAKAAGADVVLLIAACLTSKAVREIASFSRALGLNVLLEVHVEAELDAVCDNVDAIGINNRNLKTFEVDIENSLRLASMLRGKLLVAESGIKDTGTVNMLRNEGFSGFLIGERFMKEADPVRAFKTFLNGY